MLSILIKIDIAYMGRETGKLITIGWYGKSKAEVNRTL